MGLLDDLYNDPNSAGMMGIAQGLLSASGPSRMPVSFGQAMGHGMQAGMGAYQNAQNANMERQRFDQQQKMGGLQEQMLNMQLEGAKTTDARRKAFEQMLPQMPDEVKQAYLMAGPDKAFEMWNQNRLMAGFDSAINPQPTQPAPRPYQNQTNPATFKLDTPEQKNQLVSDMEKLQKIDPEAASQVREGLIQQGVIPPPSQQQQPDWNQVAQMSARAQLGGIKGATGMMELAKMNLSKPDVLKEYAFSQSQGYKGTFTDWKNEMAKAGAPSMTAINNVQAFEPFNNKVQGNMGEALVKNFETLQNIPQTLQALDAAKVNLSKAGNFVGSGAETKLAVAKFFNNNLGTNIDPTGVKNTEALQSALFYNVMDNLKKMDASPSQQQQKVMQDAFGRITTDPAALPMIIDFYKNQVVSKANEHNRRVDETLAGPSGMKFPYDIRVRLPNNTQDASKPTGQAKSIVSTGTYGGKKVVKYSDGSVDYAD